MQVTDEMVEAAVAANNEVWESSDVTNAETFHKARHSAMRAALTAALGAMWRPIETAPKDGTRMNLCWKAFCGISEHVELGRWSAKHDGWTNTYGHLFEGSPDYYQLLPTPPADGDQQ